MVPFMPNAPIDRTRRLSTDFTLLGSLVTYLLMCLGGDFRVALNFWPSITLHLFLASKVSGRITVGHGITAMQPGNQATKVKQQATWGRSGL